MPELCKPEICTGCAACKNICPRNAITMQENARGFLHPSVNQDECIECKLCESACPAINEIKHQSDNEAKVFVAWHSDLEIRLSSSSGGAFSAFAEKILSDGGVVYGAAWNGVDRVNHIKIEKNEDLWQLRRSKYVPSDIGFSFKEIKAFLKSGKKVLFSGSPCQVAGLYRYLGNTDCSLLTTVDFICHGVPSPSVYRSYLEYLDSKYGARVTNVNFRDKTLGVETNLLLKIELDNGSEKKLMFDANSFYRGFIKSIYLRDSCYKCTFNLLPRIADISMADFRGLGKTNRFNMIGERQVGFTGIIINSKKGSELFYSSPNIRYELRPNSELFNSQPHLRHPADKPSKSLLFWADFEKIPYRQLAKKYMPMSLRARIMNIGRLLLGPKLYYSIGRFMKV